MNKKIILLLVIFALGGVLILSGCSKENSSEKDLSNTSEIAKPSEIAANNPGNTATPVEQINTANQQNGLTAESNTAAEVKNETKPSIVYNAPTGLSNLTEEAGNVTYVDCPTVTTPVYLRIDAPILDEFGINKFTINDNNMDRFTFSDKWQLVKKTQLQCKEKGTVYVCPSFVVQKYVLDQYMSIKGFDYTQYSTFNIEVFDIKLDRDPLSDKNVSKASFKVVETKCTKYEAKTA